MAKKNQETKKKEPALMLNSGIQNNFTHKYTDIKISWALSSSTEQIVKLSSESEVTKASAPENRLINALITKKKNTIKKTRASGKTGPTSNDEINSPYVQT